MNKLLMIFLAEIELLYSMINYVRDRAVEAGISDKNLYKIQVSCEEAIVNIINYANVKELNIITNVENGLFDIVILDQGQPFNPLNIREKLPLKPYQQLELCPLGGFGIFLLQKLSYRTSYERIEDNNKLTISFVLN